MSAATYQCASGPDYRCLYDPRRVNEADAHDWLAHTGAKLFAQRELLSTGSRGPCSRLTLGDTPYYAKEFTDPGPRYSWLDRLLHPVSFRHFWNAWHLQAAGLPTPAPLLAASWRSPAGHRQVVVTDFIADAVDLAAYVRAHPGPARRALILSVAELLACFHARQFAAPELRTANVLLTVEGAPEQLWLADVDRLGTRSWQGARRFVALVAHIASGCWADFTPEERTFFLRACFDFALKHNIYSRPSQQDVFLHVTLAAITRAQPAG